MLGEVDVNTQDKYGWTPLMAAAFKDHPDAVRHLVFEMDANVALTDKGGKSAFDKATGIRVKSLLRGAVLKRKIDMNFKPSELALKADSTQVKKAGRMLH